MSNRLTRIQQLKDLLQQRVVVLDGAMGTMIQNLNLSEEDFRGTRFADWHMDIKGNNDILCITQPQLIKDIHLAFLRKGVDIIETNSFNATTIAQADYDMEGIVTELNIAAAKVAREAADQAEAEDGKPRFVAGVLGPTRLMSPRSTFHSCGSSSMEYCRSRCPSGVRRASSGSGRPASSKASRMVRNL